MRKVNTKIYGQMQYIEGGFINAEATISVLRELKGEGFSPKLIIVYGGRGYGLYINTVFPNAKIVTYFEWWLKEGTLKHLKGTINFEERMKVNTRNMIILQELEICDAAIVPTHWQKKQFPNAYQNKLQVIFDGIDTSFFHPAPQNFKALDLELRSSLKNKTYFISKEERVLTFATRGLEPIRGFPEFMLSLPYLFKEYEDLKVIIAGTDYQQYSYSAPNKSGSWKEYMMENIKEKVPKGSINFTGNLDYPEYRNLLWRSDLHCYFTKPYITSWSLFEAIACGATVLTNKSPATENIAYENSLLLTNLENQDEINSSIKQALDPKSRVKGVIKEEFKLQQCLAKWQDLLNKLIEESP